MPIPNCYKCVHRRNVPGSAHSACAVIEGPAAMATSFHFMQGSYKLSAGDVTVIEAIPHGVRKGWFMWPVDFDPSWLIKCVMYTPKDEEDGHA